MWYEQWITLPSTTMAEFDSGIKIGDRILQVKKKILSSLEQLRSKIYKLDLVNAYFFNVIPLS